ncbi:hypothetical protein [Sandaracinus amylolyticus]|uniref:Uncharacterized protein n=1 Tax=Sandaracinus amylolyticus TaxID=927083 RepID=A0A0F6W0E2_9BACT|nr:hypothetical protein [Sandaracinus amylolyticus]AKF04275.1 hypothetical protein DB32_001424 [Sandaracinus amylolyticus]
MGGEQEPPAKDPSPFMAFAQKHGLPMQTGWVPWQEGMRCEILGAQVLLESYAAEMPSAFIAWIAKHGGHVQTELIHAHGPLVLRAHVWMKDGWSPENHVRAHHALARFEAKVSVDPEVKASLQHRWATVSRGIHFVPNEHGGREALVAPYDVTRASRALRAAAISEGLGISFELFEWIDHESDPAEVIALSARGESLRLEIDDPGPRPEELARALTDLLGIPPERATWMVLPRKSPARSVVLDHVSRRHGELALRVVRHHGATAHLRARDGAVVE